MELSTSSYKLNSVLPLTRRADLNGKKRKKVSLVSKCVTAGVGLGFLVLPATAVAATQDSLGAVQWIQQLLSEEPSNALSIPTWSIHVASVIEWVIAMALVWQYGESENKSAWKGLSWGMVPLLGGALCACTWHFFYNAESLEVLVVLQGALTLVGNITLWIAAYRIYAQAQENLSSCSPFNFHHLLTAPAAADTTRARTL